MIGTGELTAPHSSSALDFSGCLGSKKQAVAIDPSLVDSALNLLRRRESGKDGGGTISQGRSMKSCWMRGAKCRKIAQVPALSSCDSSNVCRSIRKDGKEEEEESDWA